MNEEPQDRTASRRVAAVKLIRGGMSQAEVARLLGVSREAVRKWWDRYESGGMKALETVEGKRGPEPQVDRAQLGKVIAAARRAKLGTIAAVHRLAADIMTPVPSRSTLRRHLILSGFWQG